MKRTSPLPKAKSESIWAATKMPIHRPWRADQTTGRLHRRRRHRGLTTAYLLDEGRQARRRPRRRPARRAA